ncbi:fumarylacetoacetate hydrolase family protein, partial [Mycobacterium avium]|uniref:fumarylacetoacetate hydrolase family protein n=1 Tax=Mycobacterium avium TaxID=1764 RepID=UPI001E4C9C21
MLGYTIGNDVSARDQQRSDGQWTRAKGHDTFCPVGPWIVTDLNPLDPGDLELRTEVNGEVKQETKAKSQKAINLKRDPRVSFLIEDGDTYDTLRGVSFEGVAELVDDPDVAHRVGVSVFERYTGPYTDEMKPFVEQMMNKR